MKEINNGIWVAKVVCGSICGVWLIECVQIIVLSC